MKTIKKDKSFKVVLSRILSKTSSIDMYIAFGEKGVRNNGRDKEEGDRL